MTPITDKLAAELQSAVKTYPQMSEDEPGGYCTAEDQLMDEAAAELRRLEHNNRVPTDALWKACGDDEEVVNSTIESQGSLQ